MRIDLIAVSMIAMATCAGAQDLVYKPINPSFGGNPFNSAHLLGLADRQNLHKDSSGGLDAYKRSDSEQFQRQIQSALLGRVASQIADQILGEDAASSGTFQIDSTEISFEKIDGVISIIITDGISGGSTEIKIPAPVF